MQVTSSCPRMRALRSCRDLSKTFMLHWYSQEQCRCGKNAISLHDS